MKSHQGFREYLLSNYCSKVTKKSLPIANSNLQKPPVLTNLSRLMTLTAE